MKAHNSPSKKRSNVELLNPSLFNKPQLEYKHRYVLKYRTCIVIYQCVFSVRVPRQDPKIGGNIVGPQKLGTSNMNGHSPMPQRNSSDGTSDGDLGNYIDLLRNSLKADSMDTSLIFMFASPLVCSFGGSNTVALPPIDYHKEFEEIEKSLENSR